MDASLLSHITSKPAEVAGLITLLNYIKTVAGEPIAPDQMSLHPVSHAPTGTDNSFGTYSLLKSRGYEQEYIHNDVLKLKLYHTNFEMVLTQAALLVEKLHPDNAELVTALEGAGLRVLDILCVNVASGQGAFVDGTERFNEDFSIVIQYVVL